MPLTLKRYPKRSPYWIIRGTVAGVRVFESTDTTDRGQAEALRIRRENEIWEHRSLGKEQPATFADAVIVYLDRGRSPRFVTKLLHHFKEKPLPEIGQREVDQVAATLYPHCKPATLVRQVYGPMIAILKVALDAELPGARPRKIAMPKVAKVSPKWGSDEHLDKLLPECNAQLKALILTMTYTGLRVGECLRLRRTDFKLKQGWVNVSRTKNGEPAFVPLPPVVIEALADIMPDGLEPVFGYRTSQGANKALKSASERAGVEYLSCHQIGRHTFAARLLGAGFDIKTLKEAGRWKKLSVVDEAYGHLEKRQYHDAMLSVAESCKNGAVGDELKRAKRKK